MNDLWSDLTTRLKWNAINGILHAKGLPTALGRDKTLQVIQNACETSASQGENFTSLTQNLLDAVLFKDKYVKYFDVSQATMNSVIGLVKSSLAGFQVPNSTTSQRFPLTDTQENINSSTQSSPELIRVFESDQELTLVYSTVRKIQSREDLRDRFEGIEEAAFLRGFSSVIGVRSESIQLFDIVNFEKVRGIIEIRIDNYKELTLKILETNYNEILAEVTGMIYSERGVNLHRPHNFYSMLRKLYDDSDQGQVKEIAFVTDTKSIKHEKWKFDNDVVDLRSEPYHDKGKEAIGGFDLYRLGVSWENQGVVNSTIYLQILGNHHSLTFESGAYLNAAYIRGCHTKADYDFILNIIKDYQ